MFDSTFEEIILDRRGRGNIVSVCYDFKYQITADDVPGLAERLIPKEIRNRKLFEGYVKQTDDFEKYLIRKSRKFSIRYDPTSENREKGFLVHNAIAVMQSGGPLEDEVLERERKDLAFLYAVRAFLNHI